MPVSEQLAAAPARLSRALVGELLGTFVLVALGTGAVAASVLLGVPRSQGEIALVWGLAVCLAIAIAAPLSGAHLNPAVSVALALLRPTVFPRGLVLPYALAQLGGAALAGLLVLSAFGARLSAFEGRESLVRGQPGSERAARMFGDYFPDPGLIDSAPVGVLDALAHEALGTAALLLVVFLVSDPRRALALRPWLARALVALTVTLAISAVAPVTQAGLNPARDLGPRLVAWAAGFGEIALPGPHGGFWIYIVGPLLGGLGGAALSLLVPLPRPTPSAAAEPLA